MIIRLTVLLVCLLPLRTIAGTIDSGEAPYERCALCHGLFGDSASAKFPKLAGQPAAYLELQISHFLSGARSNDGGQMSAIVTELDASGISVAVEWFASQPHPKPAAQGNPQGEALFGEAGCGSCHNNTATAEPLPLLASQHSLYLAKQMTELRDGVREGDASGLMRQQLKLLSDADITAVADYLAARERQQ